MKGRKSHKAMPAKAHHEMKKLHAHHKKMHKHHEKEMEHHAKALEKVTAKIAPRLPAERA